MKILFMLLFLVSCKQSNMKELFSIARKNGCVSTSMSIESVDIGRFVVCTEEEYDRRMK